MSEFSKKLWKEKFRQDSEYMQRNREHLQTPGRSEACKLKRSDTLRKRWMDNDYRQKMSKMASDLGKDPIYTLKKSISMKDRWATEEYKNNRQNHIEAMKTNERRALMSRHAKRRIENHPIIHMSFLERIQNSAKTNLELRMEQLLLSLGIIFGFNYKVGRYLIDFAVPSKMIAIECDGLYWHNSQRQKERDKKRDEFLSLQGWTVIRFSEDEILNRLEYSFSISAIHLLSS